MILLGNKLYRFCLIQAFRKLLLYPTELRRRARSYVFQLALNCTPFCLLFQHISASFRALQKLVTGKHWKTQIEPFAILVGNYSSKQTLKNLTGGPGTNRPAHSIRRTLSKLHQGNIYGKAIH